MTEEEITQKANEIISFLSAFGISADDALAVLTRAETLMLFIDYTESGKQLQNFLAVMMQGKGSNSNERN